MGVMTVRFFEFSFIVHSPDRVTVLFPSAAHGLVVKHKGRTFPVPAGANLELRDGNEQPLPQVAPKMTKNYETFMPEVNFVEGTSFTVDPDRINPTMQPGAGLTAKLHLSSGELNAQECSIPEYRGVEIQFSANKSQVTDIAEFTLTGEPGTTYHLFMNGNSVRLIDHDDVLEFNNADVLGAKGAGFADLREYKKLLKEAIAEDVPVPTPVDTAFSADGIDNVCANARLKLP